MGNFPPETRFPERLSKDELNLLVTCLLLSGDFVLIGDAKLGMHDGGQVLSYANRIEFTGAFLSHHIYAGDGILKLVNDKNYRYIDMLAQLGTKKDLLSYGN